MADRLLIIGAVLVCLVAVLVLTDSTFTGYSLLMFGGVALLALGLLGKLVGTIKDR